jgi:hypothetical protein
MLLNFVGVLLLGASSSLHAARGVDPEKASTSIVSKVHQPTLLKSIARI